MCGQLGGAFHFGWARFEDELFARGFLIGGHRFETSDGFSFRSSAPFNHCSFWRTENGFKGSINGATGFDLVVGEHIRKAASNGTAYEVSQPVCRFFTADGNWDLNDHTSEAIN